MIKLDSRTIRAFIDEELEFFVNARIQKIQQPTRKELILWLRNNGIAKKLYINIHPDFYHICFMSPKNEKLRLIEQPQMPPMFCMLLRKHLEGAKITDIRHIKGERIIEIIFQNFSEFSKIDSLCLAIELMGKHSNIILYDYESKIILGCAHNIGEEKSRERELAGGLPYTYPPKQNKKYLNKTPFEEFFSDIKNTSQKIPEFISENYFDFTKFITEKLCNETIKNYKNTNVFTTETIKKLYKKMIEYTTSENYTPTIDNNNDFLLFSQKNEAQSFTTVSEMIDTYFAKNFYDFKINNQKKMLEQKILKEIKKFTATNKRLTISENDTKKMNNFKKNADLIMANLYNLKNNFSSSIELWDYETEQKITISIDNTKTPIENANNFYKLYNKNKKTIEISQKIIEENIEKISILKDYLYSAQAADTIEEVDDISIELGYKEIPKNKKQKQKNFEIPHIEINGFTVYTGKNNHQNDIIYSKISSPDDFWFHALNTPGAHILLKIKKNNFPDNNTLYECAKLAKEMSNAKNAGKASVIFTKRQFIKRPPNTKSGYVTFKNETEIVVE